MAGEIDCDNIRLNYSYYRITGDDVNNVMKRATFLWFPIPFQFVILNAVQHNGQVEEEVGVLVPAWCKEDQRRVFWVDRGKRKKGRKTAAVWRKEIGLAGWMWNANAAVTCGCEIQKFFSISHTHNNQHHLSEGVSFRRPVWICYKETKEGSYPHNNWACDRTR